MLYIQFLPCFTFSSSHGLHSLPPTLYIQFLPWITFSSSHALHSVSPMDYFQFLPCLTFSFSHGLLSVPRMPYIQFLPWITFSSSHALHSLSPMNYIQFLSRFTFNFANGLHSVPPMIYIQFLPWFTLISSHVLHSVPPMDYIQFRKYGAKCTLINFTGKQSKAEVYRCGLQLTIIIMALTFISRLYFTVFSWYVGIGFQFKIIFRPDWGLCKENVSVWIGQTRSLSSGTQQLGDIKFLQIF